MTIIVNTPYNFYVLHSVEELVELLHVNCYRHVHVEPSRFGMWADMIVDLCN